MQKDIDFNFFKTKNPIVEVRNNTVDNIVVDNRTFTLLIIMFFSALSLIAGILLLSYNKQVKGIHEFVQFIENTDKTGTSIIELNLLRKTPIKVTKEKENIIVVADKEALYNNDRIEDILLELKQKQFKVLKIEDITNLQTGYHDVQLTLKKE